MSHVVSDRAQTQFMPPEPDPNVPFARQLCRRHTQALLSLALLILDDVDAASDIVVEVLAAAGRRTRAITPSADGARGNLAASVYRRCVGDHVLRERFGLPRTGPARPDSMGPLGRLTVRQRCTVALAIFGGQDLAGTARTLNLRPAEVLRHLGDALAAMRPAAGGTLPDSRSDIRVQAVGGGGQGAYGSLSPPTTMA